MSEALSYRVPVTGRCRWRRLVVACALATVGIIAVCRWGSLGWRKVELLYWQRQCLLYSPPPDQRLSPPVAQCYRRFVVVKDRRTVLPLWPDTILLFMHERVSPCGNHRLVVVTAWSGVRDFNPRGVW